jgi:hypothetical protein
MERLEEYLRSLSVESLMSIAQESEATVFEEDSIIRRLISEYDISTSFSLGVLGLRSILLSEILRRYKGRLS